MLRLLQGVILFAWMALPATAAEPIVGRATVIDGDTIEIHGQRIRLEGIDAPESRQTCFDRASKRTIPCGRRAAFFLSDMLVTHVVSCTEDGKDRYRRVLAHCQVEGQDVGELMVISGWALAFRRYSREYVPAEAIAQKLGEGMWATEFMEPWEWRKAMRR